jgi:hypothetical protein
LPVKKNNKLLVQNSLAPLLCWDIFMEGYWRKAALANDKFELD